MEIESWREILNPYDIAVKELLTKIENVKREHEVLGLYCPIESVSGRVKSIPSILDKCRNKRIDLDEIEERVYDLAGIRIICQFVEDIYRVIDILHQRDDLEIVEERDYVEKVKTSGYRSYHMIVNYMVHTLSGSKNIRVEIQIRTMAMNFWATVEHSLQYKYKQKIPQEIKDTLLEVSEAVGHLDAEMSSVRSEIIDAQNEKQTQSNVISYILNTIQNLYNVANKKEIQKIQDEFYNVYSKNDLDELIRFSKQLDLIAEGYHAQVIPKDDPFTTL